jgi:signal transduction histidine kinase
MVTEDINRQRPSGLQRWRELMPLIGFEIAIVASLVFVSWVVYSGLSAEYRRRLTDESTMQSLNAYRSNLAELQGGLAKLANDLDADLGSAILWGNHNAVDRLVRHIGQLEMWLGEQRDRMQASQSVRKTDTLIINASPKDVITRAERIHRDLAEAAAEVEALYKPSVVMAEKVVIYERFRQATSRLRDLSFESRAQAETILGGLNVPHSTWQPLFVFRTVTFGMVVILFGWLAVLVYRRQMATIRQELAVSKSQLNRQQKLAEKGRVASELAHELRNPLTAVNIRLHTLAEALDEDTEEHRDVRLIRKEIRRLNAILEDFLHLDRVPEPVFASVSSSFLLREVADLVAPLCDQVGVRLQLEDEARETARLDPNQIKQVMINLIKNACESVDHDGTITLRCRVATIPQRNKAVPSLVFEVQDSGPGIPPSIQKRLFEPFFSTKKEGTGLGLAITERIVHRHGGTIDFQTVAGKGTTFTVTLPLEGRS